MSYVYSIFQSVAFRLLYFYLWSIRALAGQCNLKFEQKFPQQSFHYSCGSDLFLRHWVPLNIHCGCCAKHYPSYLATFNFSMIFQGRHKYPQHHWNHCFHKYPYVGIEAARSGIRDWTASSLNMVLNKTDSNGCNIEIIAVIESQSTDLSLIGFFSDNEQAGKTLSPRAWNAAFNDHGQLKLDKVLKRIRRGVRDLLHHFLNFCFCTWARTEVVIVILSLLDDVLHQPW